MRLVPKARSGSWRSALQGAMDRAADFLLDCQLPSGAINDPVSNPLAAVFKARRSRRLAFRLTGGADIWHTVNAALALRALGKSNVAAERFVRKCVSSRGELSYWSAHPSLCIETSSAAWHAFPDLRGKFARTIARHALPGGRWPNFILPGRGGYDSYLTGPSVTAWALGTLGSSHPFRDDGCAYLEKTRGSAGLWVAHPAFYSTPLYPAHLAVRFLSLAPSICRAVLLGQDVSGGWGFGDDFSTPPSALPTAFGLWTLAASRRRTAARRRGMVRAIQFLLSVQKADGSFPLAPAPAALFYTGEVYTSSVAISAIVLAMDVLS